ATSSRGSRRHNDPASDDHAATSLHAADHRDLHEFQHFPRRGSLPPRRRRAAPRDQRTAATAGHVPAQPRPDNPLLPLRQSLPLDSLRQMLRLEIRDLPGLADSPRRQVKEFELAQLPRGSHRDAAVYAVTLKEDVPEGRQLRVEVSLAFGDTEKTLWEGRL